MTDRSLIQHVAHDYARSDLRSWDDLARAAYLKANMMWNGNRSLLKRAVTDLVQGNPTTLEQALSYASVADAHRLIGLGISVINCEIRTLGPRPWTVANAAIEQALSYGRVTADAANYLYIVNQASGLLGLRGAPASFKAGFEIEQMSEADHLEKSIAWARDSALPVPSVEAVTEVLKEAFPLYPSHLYDTLPLIFSVGRPNPTLSATGTLPPEPL